MSIYQSAGYTYGTDLVYNFVVPNGSYTVRLMFGQPYDGGGPGTCSPFHPWHLPLDLETQGHLQIHNFDYGQSVNHQCATPNDAYLTAQVTDNRLEIAVRAVVPENSGAQTPAPLLNGLEIIPLAP